jgi:hypothetical protein
MKTCAKCRLEVPRTDFQRRGKTNPTLDSWCNACKRKSHRRWAAANPETKRASGAATRLRLRSEVIAYYGKTCFCCGEAEMRFLAIDHVEGGGTAHRQSLGSIRGASFYRWLRNQGFPVGYRVLCHNCNTAIGLYGNCPHQSGKNHGKGRVMVCEALAA